MDSFMLKVLDTEDPIARAGRDIAIEKGERVIFDAGASSDNVCIINYTWVLDDGRVLTGPEQNIVFRKAGRYKVTLEVEDADGNKGYDSIVVTVRDPAMTWMIVLFGIAVFVSLAGLTTFLVMRRMRNE